MPTPNPGLLGSGSQIGCSYLTPHWDFQSLPQAIEASRTSRKSWKISTLLGQLDVDGTAYPIGPSSLKRLIAMMEGSIPYLSQRMYVVEAALPADYRMVLSSAPSAIARELRGALPNLAFQLWTLPYDTMQYRSSLRDAPAALRAIEQELSLFLNDTPLASARREHFRGRFADDPPARGAKSLYIQCRMPNAQIEKLDAEQLKGLYGIPRDLDVAPEMLMRLVPVAKQRVRLAKESASYWLGLIALEEGRPKVAVDFFKQRTLAAYPNGIWKQGASYNLARSFEIIGRVSGDEAATREAIALYQADESPQSHGNKIRQTATLKRALFSASVRPERSPPAATPSRATMYPMTAGWISAARVVNRVRKRVTSAKAPRAANETSILSKICAADPVGQPPAQQHTQVAPGRSALGKALTGQSRQCLQISFTRLQHNFLR